MVIIIIVIDIHTSKIYGTYDTFHPTLLIEYRFSIPLVDI